MLIKELLEAIKLSAKDSKELDAFLEEFRAETTAHPFDRRIRIWKDSVGLEVSKFGGSITLDAIMSFLKKGEGEASKALKWVCDLADKHKVDIELIVKPIPNAGAKGKNLTKAQLTSWYQRHGFEKSHGDYMTRKHK